MNHISVIGTLGDSYITVCRLYSSDVDTVLHYNPIIEWNSNIEKIYSLLPSLKVTISNDIKDNDSNFIPLPKYDDMTWFPEFFTKKYNYNVIQTNSGKPEEYQKNHKLLSKDVIYDYINYNNGNFILIGTTSYYETIKHHRLINLVNKTSILEAMKIVAESASFFGPEGLMSFVAISHKVYSTIFYTSYQAVNARIIDTPWHEYCKLVG